jgi:hypothetical protein
LRGRAAQASTLDGLPVVVAHPLERPRRFEPGADRTPQRDVELGPARAHTRLHACANGGGEAAGRGWVADVSMSVQRPNGVAVAGQRVGAGRARQLPRSRNRPQPRMHPLDVRCAGRRPDIAARRIHETDYGSCLARKRRGEDDRLAVGAHVRMRRVPALLGKGRDPPETGAIRADLEEVMSGRTGGLE